MTLTRSFCNSMACLLAALLSMSSLHAQSNLAAMNLAMGNLNLGRISLAERSQNQSQGQSHSRGPVQSTGRGASGLMFTSSPVVSAKLRETIEQKILAQAQPERRAEIQQTWLHFQPVAGFNNVLMQHGYSPNNLADVSAAYWILCWQVVHGTPDPPAATIRAVDEQLRRSLLTNEVLARLRNDEKQQLAELMAYEAVLGISATRGPEARSHATVLESVRANVATQFQQLAGLDLHRLELTPSGFVEK